MTASTRRRAEEWLAADPDPDTGSELEGLLAGDPAELERRFSGRLAFGTAGIRGPMGAGPLRMNRVLVRIVAAALAERVLAEGEESPLVVVGHDSRHRSDVFSADTARVLAARGIRATVVPEPIPTPVLAFAVKHLEASAGVVVTASHNPSHGQRLQGLLAGRPAASRPDRRGDRPGHRPHVAAVSLRPGL